MGSQERLIYPPTDGTILLPDTLSFHTQNNANAPVYIFMEDDSEDTTQITYGQFERACHRASRFIQSNISESVARPVVAVIALADTLVYQTIVMGIMAAGFVPFPISPRNTALAIVNLLRTTSCYHIVATSHSLKDLFDHLQQELEHDEPAYTVAIQEAPNMFDLYPELSSDNHLKCCQCQLPIPYHPTPFSSKSKANDIALYLHSSGSTGNPKAIPKTHRDIMEYVLSPCCAIFRDRPERTRMSGMQLPPFHALGIVTELFLPLFLCVSVVFFPPVVKNIQLVPMLATPETVLRHVKRTRCSAIVAIPAFLQVWANEPESIAILRGLELVISGGGGISQKLGDFLVGNGVALQNVYGGTEVGGPAFSSQRPGDEKEWEYVEFNKTCKVRWIPHGGDTYECQLITTPTHHLSVCNLPDVEGFATSDLFERHPTKDYLWKILGRLDDVIIHSSGEKTVPPPLEGVIMSSSHIMGVVMFGNGRDQVGVLIEPTLSQVDVTDAKQVAHFRNLVWPVIEEANQIAPAYSKIFKEMILITDRRKPLPRAPKGTVIRKLALKIYAEEIDALYVRIVSSHDVESYDAPRRWDLTCITEWLLSQAHDLCPGKTLSTSENMFEQGFDSLSATILRRRIIGALQSTAKAQVQSIAQNIIYRHPTLEELAVYILRLSTDSNLSANSSAVIPSRTRDIEAMIRKYELPSSTLSSLDPPRSTSILLTGSTGHLGSEILESLLQDARIAKVFTLNRPSIIGGRSSMERHTERFRDQGLDEGLLNSDKLVFLESDISEDRLGLSASAYAELRSCVTVVIHAAWKLDFNLSLASFEPHVRGTHNLLALARAAPHAASVKFIFTSSVSTAQAWDRSAGLYPEDVVLDAKYAVGLGYGESKYVAERIIAASGLAATSLRIGQITGSANGAWAASDWVPILVKSSIGLGCLPAAHGNVFWLPMAAVAACVLDLVAHTPERYPAALNVAHPRAVRWDAVMAHISAAVQQRGSRGAERLPLVPFAEWFALLEARGEAAAAGGEVEAIPGIKLLDFFRHLRDGANLPPSASAEGAELEVFGTAGFSTATMQTLSKTLADLPPLAPGDAHRWVKYWDSCGVLA